MKFLQSLTWKMTFSFVLLITLVSGFSFFYTVQSSRKALLATLGDGLKGIASITASQINGDLLLDLKPGDETKPAYKQVQAMLLKARKDNPDIRYSYIMRPNGDHIEFVVDDTFGQEDDAAGIGEVYTSTDSARAELDQQEILAGLEAPGAASELVSDKWGTFLSGYAPVKNSKGEVVGVLGVDMSASRVLSKENFINQTNYVVLFVAILLAAIIIAIFSSSVSRDIRRLNALAKKISRGQVAQSNPLHRKDELGELSKTFDLMEGNIRLGMSRDIFGTKW